MLLSTGAHGFNFFSSEFCREVSPLRKETSDRMSTCRKASIDEDAVGTKMHATMEGANEST